MTHGQWPGRPARPSRPYPEPLSDDLEQPHPPLQYQPRDAYPPRDAYSARHGYQPRDDYPPRDAYPAGDEYPPRDAYPARDEYRPRNPYQPREQYPGAPAPYPRGEHPYPNVPAAQDAPPPRRLPRQLTETQELAERRQRQFDQGAGRGLHGRWQPPEWRYSGPVSYAGQAEPAAPHRPQPPPPQPPPPQPPSPQPPPPWSAPPPGPPRGPGRPPPSLLGQLPYEVSQRPYEGPRAYGPRRRRTSRTAQYGAIAGLAVVAAAVAGVVALGTHHPPSNVSMAAASRVASSRAAAAAKSAPAKSVPARSAPARSAPAETTGAAKAEAGARTPARVVARFHGTGITTTARFSVSSTWRLDYTFSCAALGQAGNFIVMEDGSFGAQAVDELATSKTGSSYAYGDAGAHYLEIDSECSWTVKVSDVG